MHASYTDSGQAASPNWVKRKAIEAAGAAVCFLSAYSPDLDPIEQVFAKLKNTLRKMARRTVDALWDAIGIALDDFSPEGCFN
jgi:transposase